MSELSIPKGKKVKAPIRDPDMISKRGVPYWWAPEWVRISGVASVGRIVALKNESGFVDLNMVSKDGNITYIQGSIQREFHKWHEDRQIDAILLGINEDDILVTAWEYE